MGDEDRYSWVAVQRRTFSRWANQYLSERMLKIEDCCTDLGSGIELINLLEIISAKEIGVPSKNPRSKFQKLENLNRALKFIKDEGLRLESIGPEDIMEGKEKLSLGMIWTLILRYQINIGAGSPKWELLQWVRKQVEPYDVPQPDNFSRDWKDGKVLSALTDSMETGCMTGFDMSGMSGNPRDDTDRSMEHAEDNFDIPRILDVEDLVDAEIPDELSVMTYVSYFKEYMGEAAARKREEMLRKKRTPFAANCFADGPGLEGADTYQPAAFCIHARNCFDEPLDPAHGGDEFKVEISGPADVTQNLGDNGDGDYPGDYTVTKEGEYTISITYEGENIKDSPFTVFASGPLAGSSYADGPGVEGANTKQPAPFTIHSVDSKGNPCSSGGDQFKAVVSGPEDVGEVPLTDNGDGTFDGTYTVAKPGHYTVDITLDGEPIKDSPFNVLVQAGNAGNSWAEGEGIEKGIAFHPSVFTIHAVDVGGEACTEGGDPFEVAISGPAACAAEVVDNGDGTYGVTYTPDEPGDYEVDVSLHGEHIKDAPFNVPIKADSNAQQSFADGPGVEGANAGEDAPFTVHCVDSKGKPVEAGGDDFKVSVSGPEDVGDVPLTDNGDGTYDGAYNVEKPGFYDVDVTLEGEPIKDSPFRVLIQNGNAANSWAEGEGIEKGQALHPCVFTIHAVDPSGSDCTKGGDPFEVAISGPAACAAEVVDNGDGTYGVTYTPDQPGDYEVDVSLHGEHIKDAPFSVPIKAASSAGNSYAEGPGLEEAWDNEPAEFTIFAVDPEGNRRTDGGDDFQVEFDGPGPVEPEVTDKGDGTYEVIYEADEPGDYTINVTCEGEHIKDSPFSVTAKEGTDAANSGFGSFTFTVHSKDKRGNPKTFGGDKFEVKVSNRGDPDAEMESEGIDNGDGSYTAKYTLSGAGKFLIDVKLNGKKIKGSPFKQTL